MQTGVQERWKVIVLAALLALAAGVGYWELAPSRSPLPAAVHTAALTRTPAAQLDPRLHLDRLAHLRAIRYDGNGRDLFALGMAPAVAAARARELAASQQPAAAVAPMPPRPVAPPLPPPIPLRAFGYATAPGSPRKAFLLLGSEVYIASPGQIVEHRYQLVRIDPASVLIMDLQTHQTASIPLPPVLVNPGHP